jgi:hypothetical protein
MKFLNFFLFLWVMFALLDPDSKSGYGSTDLVESGSYPDPDPIQCHQQTKENLDLYRTVL